MCAASNPFATCCVRPGAIPFLFPAGSHAEGVIDRLRANRWRGAIVGPHGSGKSTLLHTLLPLIEQQGRDVRYVTLHDRQRRLPPETTTGLPGDRPGQLIVDGYEQLPPWRRWALRRWTRARGVGLLVTTHRGGWRAAGLPLLWQTKADVTTARRLVERLGAGRSDLIKPVDVDAAFGRSGGNLREALFRLYDVYERRRRQPR